MPKRIDWLKRLRSAERREAQHVADAEYFLQSITRRRSRLSVRQRARVVRQAERHARLADRAAADVAHAQTMLGRAMQRYQKTLAKKTVPIPTFVVPDEDDDMVSVEWEFGFEYISMERDVTHNVDVNFHVRRDDGQPFGKAEARAVMRAVATDRGRIPYGYRAAAVDWRSPSKSTSWKIGTLRDVLSGALVNVLDTMAREPEVWRLGNPKWED